LALEQSHKPYYGSNAVFIQKHIIR